MYKTRKFLLLIIVLVFFVRVVSAEVVLVLGTFEIVDTDNPKKCNEGLYPWDRNICFIWNAAYYKEERFCQLTEDKGARDNCYIHLAVYSKNKDFCTKSDTDREYCIKAVDVINQKNPTLCENMEFPESCFYYYALSYSDWDSCLKSRAPPQCLINIIQEKGDISLCKKIKGEYDNSFCYTYFAVKGKKPELCDKSDTPESCFLATAITLQDITLCNMTGYDESNCKDRITRLQARLKNDASICEQAGSDMGNCYDDLALLNNDEEMCKKGGWEENCLKMLELKRNATKRDINFKLNVANGKSDLKILPFIIVGLGIIGVIAFYFIKKKKITVFKKHKTCLKLGKN